jgi:1,4-alpha-glucan branching enzyme
VPVTGTWRERVNTDAECYGGSNVGGGGTIETERIPAHGHDASLLLTLPPLATVLLQPE